MVHQRLPDIRALNVLEVYQLLAKYTTWQATPEELKANGWEPYLQAGVVGISTSGYLVWTGDASGRRAVVEQNSATMLLYTGYDLVNSTSGKFTAYQSTPGLVYYADYIGYIDFTSNVGGTIDADVTVKAALADYYGVVRLGKIWASANVAAGATLVIENGAGVALRTLYLPALTAYTPSDVLDGIYLYALLKTTNSKIYFDTTSANWGNATAVHIEILGHYEK